MSYVLQSTQNSHCLIDIFPKGFRFGRTWNFLRAWNPLITCLIWTGHVFQTCESFVRKDTLQQLNSQRCAGAGYFRLRSSKRHTRSRSPLRYDALQNCDIPWPCLELGRMECAGAPLIFCTKRQNSSQSGFIYSSHELSWLGFCISTNWSLQMLRKRLQIDRSEQTFQSRTMVATFRFTACCPRLDRNCECPKHSLNLFKAVGKYQVFFGVFCFVTFCLFLFLHIGSLQKFGKSLHCLQLMWLTLPRHVRPLLLFPQSYQALRASRQSAPSERWKTSTCLKILATHHVLAKHGQVWCGPQIWRLFLATFRLWMEGKNAAIIHWKLGKTPRVHQ